MKFTVATVLALAAVAFAYPRVEDNAPVKRQTNVNNLDAHIPAMTDKNGNVIPFDANNVYQAATAQGL